MPECAAFRPARSPTARRAAAGWPLRGGCARAGVIGAAEEGGRRSGGGACRPAMRGPPSRCECGRRGGIRRLADGVHALRTFAGKRGARAFTRSGVNRAIRFGQALVLLNCGFVGARGIMYAAPKSRVVGAAMRMADQAPRTSCGAPTGRAASAQDGLQGMHGMAGMAGAHARRQRRMSPQCRTCACG